MATLLTSAAGAAGATASATTPPMTGVVGQFHTTHLQTLARLRGLQGADFDSAFVNAQVAGHEQVLTILQQAQTQAQDSSVRQHVTQATQSVQTHLERARELQQAVMTGGTGPGTPGDTASKAKSDTARPG